MVCDLRREAVEAALEFLQCPNSKTPLNLSVKGDLVSADGKYVYPVRDGVICFVSDVTDAQPTSEDTAGTVREYYDAKGWEADDNGIFNDTRAFVDTREVPLEYTRKCMKRLNKYFTGGGRYLLDAGSGPIPHREYLEYSAQFAHRVCVDFSLAALHIAQSKVGGKGIYIQGDLTKIPIKDGSIEAITCNHVIYHIPEELQAAALRELWRVLRPGGVAVVVYAWSRAPIAGVLRRLARLFMGNGRSATVNQPELYFSAHSLDWFRSQPWPFRYTLDTFRIIDNDFMRKYVGNGWSGRTLLRGLYALQVLFPGFCGRYGAYPAIVIHKD
jgi:SAM-dependent methyltransferase/uncharacterized protein YbaR (Trm112 family)